MAEIHEVKEARVTGKVLTVRIDGAVYTFDLSRHSRRLAAATPEQCANIEVGSSDFGFHWPDVDEDLSIDGMIRDERAGILPAVANPALH
jgi:hypothetical protein